MSRVRTHKRRCNIKHRQTRHTRAHKRTLRGGDYLVTMDENRRIGLGTSVGNSCYIDSILQLLADSSEFVEFLNIYNISLRNGGNTSNPLIPSLIGIIQLLHKSSQRNTTKYDVSEHCGSSYIRPEVADSYIQHIVPTLYTSRRQEDAPETLNILLESIYELYSHSGLNIVSHLPFEIFENSLGYNAFLQLTISPAHTNILNNSANITMTNLIKYNNPNLTPIYGESKDLIICVNRLNSKYAISKRKLTDIAFINVADIDYKLRGIIVYTGTGRSGHYRYIKYNDGRPSLVFNGPHVCTEETEPTIDIWSRAINNIETGGTIYLYRKVLSVNITSPPPTTNPFNDPNSYTGARSVGPNPFNMFGPSELNKRTGWVKF